jgi:rRNA maturation RNase YbeY
VKPERPRCSCRCSSPTPRTARCCRATACNAGCAPRWSAGADRGAHRRRDEGRGLNRDWRGKDYATNVLTFDYERDPVVMADLVLCAPVVEREARAAGKALDAHYAHLLVHGVLHAQGWDHERAADARRMEARESALLQALGFPDPYRPGR